MDWWRVFVPVLIALTTSLGVTAEEPTPAAESAAAPTASPIPEVPPVPDGLGVVTDPGTGLLWTDRDNGDDVAWERAGRYCAAMEAGGHDDWRLPTIDELEVLFDPSSSAKHKVRLGIALTQCCVWADTVEEPGETAWFYFFNEGYRKPFDVTYPYNLRALCVRGGAE
jgi:hypothetical protein